MAEFTAQDGTVVNDGDLVKLVVSKGSKETIDNHLQNGDYSERTISGTVRSFQQSVRILDEEGYAVDKTIEDRWEVVTDDPAYPAIGFVPENVVSVS